MRLIHSPQFLYTFTKILEFESCFGFKVPDIVPAWYNKNMHNFFHEFKKFIARGNVVDLAVGVVIGTAFQKIVSSLVSDIVLPFASPFLNNTNFSEWRVGGVHIGNFIEAIIDFIIIALFVFLFVRFVNRFRKREEAKPADISKEVALLTEIRDILKKGKS